MPATVAEIDSIDIETEREETVVRADAGEHASPLRCTSGYSGYCSAYDDSDTGSN